MVSPTTTGHSNPQHPAEVADKPQTVDGIQINRAFDFNRTPMAPLETKVLIHETTQKSQTWGFHDREEWYIGTAPLHYQCYTIYVMETRGNAHEK